MKQTNLFSSLLVNTDKAKQMNKKLAQKTQNVKAVTSASNTLQQKLEAIKHNVGKLQDNNYLCIRTENELDRYFSRIYENGIVSIDTETTGLNPITDEVVGISLFTPGEKACYIPCGHCDLNDEPFKNQITHLQLHSHLEALTKSNVKIILHNAKFDLRFLKNTFGLDNYLTPYFDTYIAGNLLNENEPHGLKVLYKKYCNSEDVALSYDNLFEKVNFKYVPIEYSYVYAAKDAEMTYELYQFQQQFFNVNSPNCHKQDLVDTSNLLFNIEMPLVTVLCEMEDRGVGFDKEYAKQLSVEYNVKLGEIKHNLDEFVSKTNFSLISPMTRQKLSNPINLGSPTQLAIFIYDVLKLQSVDKKNPRGTGEDILKKLEKVTVGDVNQFFRNLLDYREVNKLLSAFIDKLPHEVNGKTNKIHPSYNSQGAKTGRFSSNAPNVQQIPSGRKEVRKLFVPTEGYAWIGCDFSAQEPRIMAQVSGDKNMISSFIHGKDIYASLGELVYRIPYEECLEFRTDGSKNPEGKKRRGQMKIVLLATMYGMSANSVAQILGMTKKEAEGLLQTFYKNFPQVDSFIKGTHSLVSRKGFVKTLGGRKRRLPTAKEKDNVALRQSVNSIIQGSAAVMTKLAMVKLGQDKVLKENGFKLLMTIHDEIVGECPLETANVCSKRVEELMNEAGKDLCPNVPFKCDSEITDRWAGNDLQV